MTPTERFWILTSLISLLLSCNQPTPTLFESIPAQSSGVNFENRITSTPELNILNYIYYYNGAGVATADFNNDGKIDLYFTGNQSPDALYLNQGDFQFEEVSQSAGIENATGWTNGVAIVDINNDQRLDLYISKVGDYHSLKGHNLLYVNQGNNEKNVPVFKEEASKYGLDFSGFSTHATFFDYDLDGDLDLYLLNHSTNPNQNYGKGTMRTVANKESGDKFFENQEGTFVDVSEAANIFQSKFGYGLGVSVSDLNLDGYPDIYVSNDFFENDYLYLNNGDKTFSEVIHASDSIIGHTTHYSMGNDIHDINNDGYPDIVSLDMLPEDPKTYKTSGTEFNYQIYQNYIRNGYAYQYMQNALQLNNGNGTFSEIGQLSGIAATEWSWSALIADYDKDGQNDLFISNGILGATNDMDFINFIANDNIQKTLGQGMTEKEMAFIDKIPAKKTPNYFFQNKGNSQFENVTDQWFQELPSYSNGSAYADLDNDGDLDLVVNNVNEKAFVLKNNSESFYPNRHSLKIQFEGPENNHFGIGAKVMLFMEGQLQLKENFPSRGYLSSVAPELVFGIGEKTMVDSLVVRWPDGKQQRLTNILADEALVVAYAEANAQSLQEPSYSPSLYQLAQLPIDFKHRENRNLEFNRDPLLPFALGNEGPALAKGDVNNDGLEDIFFGGAKGQASVVFQQQSDGSFQALQPELFALNSLAEDVDAVFVDLNEDQFQDLIVVSGGNELNTGEHTSPRLYWNRNGQFEKDTEAFQEINMNASKISLADWDGNGTPDLVFLSNTLPQKFGRTPAQHFYTNMGDGRFLEVTESVLPQNHSLTHVNDIVWSDFNQDGQLDFIAAGDWMPLQIYLQRNGKFELADNNGLGKSHGLWNTLEVADFDRDGDLDLLAGNWGLNTRLKASEEQPIRLYKVDFDDNGSEETVLTYYYKGIETTLASKEELAKQMPMINKNFLSFEAFAEASMEDLFSVEKLNKALKKEVYEIGSCFFENTGNLIFEKHLLPFDAQVSTLNAMKVDDFIGGNSQEVLIIGNNYELSTQLGRLDAQYGALLHFKNGKPQILKGVLPPLSGAGRKIVSLTYGGDTYWVVARNNDKPLFIKKKNHAEHE